MSEFPTPWHRETYIDGLEREVAGAKRRIEELAETDATEQTITDAKAALENARAELARVKGEKKAAAPKKAA